MVLHVMKWNLNPEKADAYLEFTKSAIPRLLAIPGVLEFRAYRPVTGDFQIVVTYEFADLAAWAAFRMHADAERTLDELRAFVTDLNVETWGPSPVVPAPIRPGG